jgi:ABC-2 type transport system permease protein
MSFGHGVTIAVTFLRRQLRDPINLVMLVVVPLVVAFVFGLADQRANDALPAGIVRLDHGPLANDLVHRLDDESELRLREFSTRSELDNAIRRGDVFAGIVIPPTYDASVQRGQRAQVDIVGDAKQSAFQGARAATLLVVDRENVALAIARQQRAPGSLDTKLAAAHATIGDVPVTVERRTATAETPATGLGRSTAGMLVFFLFEAAMAHAAVLLEDRRRGVVSRMATTPTRDIEIVGGEMAGRLILSAIQAVLIVASGIVLFGIDWGSPLGVIAVTGLFALVATSISVIVGSRARMSTEQLTFTTVGLLATLGLLGGCFFSLTLVPEWLRVLGHLSPHAWAVDAFGRLVATNGGLRSIIGPVLVLAAFAITLFVVAVRRLRTAVD